MNCHQLRGLKQHKLITLSFWTSEVQKWVLQRCLQAWRLWEEAISLPLAAFRNWWSCITPTSASPSHLLHWPSPSHLSLTGILVITRGHLDNPRGSLPLSVLNWITAEVPLSCKVTYSQVPQIRMWTSSRRSLFCLWYICLYQGHGNILIFLVENCDFYFHDPFQFWQEVFYISW